MGGDHVHPGSGLECRGSIYSPLKSHLILGFHNLLSPIGTGPRSSTLRTEFSEAESTLRSEFRTWQDSLVSEYPSYPSYTDEVGKRYSDRYSLIRVSFLHRRRNIWLTRNTRSVR